VVQVPFEQGITAIATAYVRHCPDRSASRSNATPILLLHGFDSSLLEFRRLLPLLATQHETWAAGSVWLWIYGVRSHPCCQSSNHPAAPPQRCRNLDWATCNAGWGIVRGCSGDRLCLKLSQLGAIACSD
jgi:hypothetical protein